MAEGDRAAQAINRLASRLDQDKEQQADRIARIFERLDERFDRLEAKVDLKIDKLDRDTQRELTEARRDVGELRDIVQRQGERIDGMEAGKSAQLEASAAGAARGAGQAVGEAAAATARITAAEVAKGFMATTAGKAIAVCTAFTTLMVALNNIPDFVRGWDHVWAFLKGAP